MPQRTDVSLVSLILINILFGAYFVYLGGEVGTLLWVYWSQSVIIGIVNFFRILKQKVFSVEGLKINDVQAEKTEGVKRFTAFFFLIHYGFFHLAYLAFLHQMVPDSLNSGLILGAVLFALHHIFSFVLHYSEESMIEKNIGKLMFYPYVRIIPMHFIILGGGIFIAAGNQTFFLIAFFIALKTVADIGMHIVEHRLFRK